MKTKVEKITSIFAVVSFISTFIIILLTEPEIVEAIAGGLILGGFIGSVFGIVSLIINKGESKSVTILSVIPMVPVVIWLFLFILSR